MLATQVKNDNAYKERQLEAGNKRVTLMAPIIDHGELKQIADVLRQRRASSVSGDDVELIILRAPSKYHEELEQIAETMREEVKAQGNE